MTGLRDSKRLSNNAQRSISLPSVQRSYSVPSIQSNNDSTNTRNFSDNEYALTFSDWLKATTPEDDSDIKQQAEEASLPHRAQPAGKSGKASEGREARGAFSPTEKSGEAIDRLEIHGDVGSATSAASKKIMTMQFRCLGVGDVGSNRKVLKKVSRHIRLVVLSVAFVINSFYCVSLSLAPD